MDLILIKLSLFSASISQIVNMEINVYIYMKHADLNKNVQNKIAPMSIHSKVTIKN